MITASGEKQSMTIDECFERLETLFKAYQKDSEFNYQLTSTNSAFNQLKNKVFELKNIEEEFGIDLITLFKAIKNKIEILDNGPSYTELCDLVYVRNGGSYLFCPISNYKVFVKDYGKTWTLTKKDSKMNKALEAYESLCSHLDYDNDDYMFNGGYEEDNEVIETALKRLEEIDSRSSMRMENIVPHLFEENEELKKRLNEMYELREHYHLDQKKLKALDIIKDKQVNISTLFMCFERYDLEKYNELVASCFDEKSLTQEEYELLKEVFYL